MQSYAFLCILMHSYIFYHKSPPYLLFWFEKVLIWIITHMKPGHSQVVRIEEENATFVKVLKTHFGWSVNKSVNLCVQAVAIMVDQKSKGEPVIAPKIVTIAAAAMEHDRVQPKLKSHQKT